MSKIRNESKSQQLIDYYQLAEVVDYMSKIRNESKSQQSWSSLWNMVCCRLYVKDTKRKQITTATRYWHIRTGL